MSLDSTIDAGQAAGILWDAIIIGAGPAGALTGRQLSQAGKRVLLLEAKTFPREKVCGGCINQTALSALKVAGLPSVLSGVLAVPIRDYLIMFRGRKLRILSPGGIAVSRAIFDARLVQAALASGVEFLSGTIGTLIPGDQSEYLRGDCDDHHFRKVQLEQSGASVAQVRGKVVVIADGVARKSLRRTSEIPVFTSSNSWIGLQASSAGEGDDPPAGQVRMLLGPGGYAGVVRIENDVINLAAAVSPHALRHHGTPSALVSRIFQSAGMAIPHSLDQMNWHGTGPLTGHCRSVAGQRVVVVGDAAGYIEPFTGEGVAHALSSALDLADLLLSANEGWSPQLSSAWNARYRGNVAARQRICRSLASALHRPWATELVFRLASFCPVLPQFLVSRIHATLAGAAAL